ncbi:hypothetical protein S40285_06296 [Stachybotrys chlorohalonatus IBT 40285]|uniref:Uncharacterized protein n=1 Tax=Stachybotrys chlorohalonatus (strain IBT 40285) TaxID=1283841 RepID=A0A084QTD3_STAC4|nr:hypothetical protein S40285_06296 [Stachybotrys chlorohalonata IBT 40285]
MSFKLNILITGCSAGGMGAALAIAFHRAGHHVYATARNTSKLAPLVEQGIETLALDVISESSIAAAVETVTAALPDGKGLDILVNNAGGSYVMPVADMSLPDAKRLFDLNVWSYIAVTQAFLPLLLKATRSIVVNHTSVGSIFAFPFQGTYNASKAAMAMFSETMRLELAPFGIRVVDLKTGGVKTNIIANTNANAHGERLPKGSIYEPARDIMESTMTQEKVLGFGTTAEQWATDVSAILLRSNPPAMIWKGEMATLCWLISLLPWNPLTGFLRRLSGLDVLEKVIVESRKQAA